MPEPGTPGIMNLMPSHEEGEFELVLGNKQLLSVFFLVILLLGVFFSMGYIVGRNTAPSSTLSASSKQPPILVDPVGPGGGIPRPPDVHKPSPLASDPPKVDPPKLDPPKVVDPPKGTKADPPKVDPPKPKPDPVKPPKPDPPKAVTPGKVSGTFLQVVATKRHEAEQMVASLSGKGFPALISPVPDSALVRVVVGPLDAAAVAKTRSGLEAAGFKPILRKF
jgi:outer membrane biosynthesis protein TonB